MSMCHVNGDKRRRPFLLRYAKIMFFCYKRYMRSEKMTIILACRAVFLPCWCGPIETC